MLSILLTHTHTRFESKGPTEALRRTLHPPPPPPPAPGTVGWRRRFSGEEGSVLLPLGNDDRFS